MNDEISYNPVEAAKILRAHPETVRRMIARGEIEYFRVGRVYRIRKSALDRFMSDKRSTAAQEDKGELKMVG